MASRNKAILHTDASPGFSRIGSIEEMEEFLAQSRTILGAHMLVLDKHSGSLDDTSNSDNLLDRSFYTFFILKGAKHGDFDSYEIARKQSLEISKQIMSQLIKWKRESTNGLNDLDLSSIHYDSIGPLGTGYLGTMVTFSLYNPAGIIYNEADWNNGQ